MQTNQLQTPPRRSITSSFGAKMERPCSKLCCGQWDLRATKSRQVRGQLCTPRSLFNTPKNKSKRSPQPSVNSSTAKNDCPYLMSSSRPNERQPNNMYDPYSDDDNDVMDYHMVCQLTSDIPTRQLQRNCPHTDDQYIKFLLSGNLKSIRNQLRMEITTFMELVKLIVRKNVVDWSNMRLSLEELLAMFLFICGQNSGTRNAGDRFQHSNETIHRYFVLMKRALGNLAPFVIQPLNMAVTPPKIQNDRCYWPWFKDEFFDAEESSEKDEYEDDDEDEDEDEGEGGSEGASEVQGEVGVENVHENEDGVPAMQQHNHVNMSHEQLLQMGQWRDEVAASMWEAYNNR
ncbi:hypothetical protein LOK49_LG03G02978 [Camellia lanceoleosa]|uniref:Uncharacterized protein n=1 Tax=Camellia lanceoleosa TaxID=1840588 RepID=A0ACC0IAG9_9ERIC|nr:hypothetical protein LOK49_LG03G02978 [Camellia lanceoleosa]